MIKTLKKTTKVEFAKNRIGVISVDHSRAEGEYKLILQQMVSEKLVGESLTKEDIKNLPKVELEFHNVASIDILIARLEHIKQNMQYPYGFPPYYLAC